MSVYLDGTLLRVYGIDTDDNTWDFVEYYPKINGVSLAHVMFGGKIPFTLWRVHDRLHALLPSAATADDLGIDSGTFGTSAPTLSSGDAKAATVTRYAGVQVPLNLQGKCALATLINSLTVRVNAGMVTTVADNSATIDIEAYRVADPDTDLCETDAQSINSLDADNKDFTLDAENLVPGDILDIRLTVYVKDAATATAVTAQINSVELVIT